MGNDLALVNKTDMLATAESFDLLQRMGKAFASSTIVPDIYKGNMANCMIAINIAQRVGADALMVMQNLDVIYGRPSWRATYISASISSCGRFHPLRYEIKEEKEEDFEYEIFETKWIGGKKNTDAVTKKIKLKDKKCIAWTLPKDMAIDDTVLTYARENKVSIYEAVKAMLPIIEGPEVSLKMACREGWYDKSGSKWKTMQDLMLNYRATSFFGRLHAPELTLGMYTVDEVVDMGPDNARDVTPKSDNSKLEEAIKNASEEENAKSKASLEELLQPVNQSPNWDKIEIETKSEPQLKEE